MNAYELADKLDLEPYGIYGEQAANMLRQQADRIAELEKSAEPVAWIKKDTLIFLGNYEFASITIQVQKQKDDEFDIPLYTTPQIKKLSDEEIIEIRKNTKANSTNNWADSLAFAKAILKKAIEK